jgi:hypothetical protein
MNYKKLNEIITNEAFQLKENAGYSGAWNDGGSGSLLDKLESFRQTIIFEEDLRPSEYYKIDNIEVGEPEIFKQIIEDYKIKYLLKNIKI